MPLKCGSAPARFGKSKSGTTPLSAQILKMGNLSSLWTTARVIGQQNEPHTARVVKPRLLLLIYQWHCCLYCKIFLLHTVHFSFPFQHLVILPGSVVQPSIILRIVFVLNKDCNLDRVHLVTVVVQLLALPASVWFHVGGLCEMSWLLHIDTADTDQTRQNCLVCVCVNRIGDKSRLSPTENVETV